MDEVGHPERGLRGALVGGTNGKGSVVAMSVAILGAAGLRVGTMPKPHLVSYRERIAIDGEPLAARRLRRRRRARPAGDRPGRGRRRAAHGVRGAHRRGDRRAGAPGVDLAIVEVGIGGRLDATNVLDLGVAAITNVQRDHEAILGPP